MINASLASISFVINAAYTGTFANAILFMSVKKGADKFSYANLELSYERVICGVICLVMTLRFFFGNNKYITEIMSDTNRSPMVKFYHFFFIALQSVILVISSYFVPEPVIFIWTICALFAIEVFWYFLTMLVDPKGVLSPKLSQRKAFFWAEMTNLGLVVVILLASDFLVVGEKWWLNIIFFAFLANTIYDAKANMKNYMA